MQTTTSSLLWLLALAATVTEGSAIRYSKEDVHLVLEPSASRIEAWIVDGNTAESLDLKFSFLFEEERASTNVNVEYAVIRLPVEDLELADSTNYCDENACHFMHDTDLVLASGVGTKVSSSQDNGQDKYLWCGTNNEDGPSKDQDLFHLIHNDNTRQFGSIQVPASAISSQNSKAIDISLLEESGYYYIVLLANCNIHGHSVLVDGNLNGRDSSSSKEALTDNTGPDPAHQQNNNHQSRRRRKPSEQEIAPWQAMGVPLMLFGILGAVYLIKEKEGREISEEDAYYSNTRNAGYKSLPMMDLNR